MTIDSLPRHPTSQDPEILTYPECETATNRRILQCVGKAGTVGNAKVVMHARITKICVHSAYSDIGCLLSQQVTSNRSHAARTIALLEARKHNSMLRRQPRDGRFRREE